MIRMALVVLALAGSAMQAQTSQAPPASVRVCCRPLPKWSGSKNPVLFGLNKLIVSHLRHCYIDLGRPVTLPGAGFSMQTSGIHPIRPVNADKQPIPDQITDALIGGGQCNQVPDATPEKVRMLEDELASGVCHSCASHYHNRPFSFCYNNSNTYVYDLISGAGMTPPKMHGAPGYHPHRACVRGEKRTAEGP